jgi:hypothetical protein
MLKMETTCLTFPTKTIQPEPLSSGDQRGNFSDHRGKKPERDPGENPSNKEKNYF